MYVSIQACRFHIDCQVPNEYSRVEYLIDGIEDNDTVLHMAITVVEDDDMLAGKQKTLSWRSPTSSQRIPWLYDVY